MRRSDAVLLQSVILPDRTKVVVAPPATLRCTMAEEVARWLREDVAPAVLKLGAPLHGLDEAGSYECRGFNRVVGATLSQHGSANALDVRALRLVDGRVIGLTDVGIAKDWREGLRTSACARFTTVLGPGSDSYHEEHIHLDLAERHGGYRLCQWDVREPIAQEGRTKRNPPRIVQDRGAGAVATPASCHASLGSQECSATLVKALPQSQRGWPSAHRVVPPWRPKPRGIHRWCPRQVI